MRTILRILSVAFVAFIVTSCATSRSTVAKNVDLSRYEYASVINNDTYHIPAELMEYEIQLFDAVEDSRLTLVSDARIYQLSQSQQDKLLLVKYGVTVQSEETIVTVNFIDFTSGRPVVSCRATYSTLGIAGSDSDIRGAIKRVAKQISETFPHRSN